MIVEENKIKGGVIIMGSLFWEDQNNCLPGDTKAIKRSTWRKDNLDINNAIQISLPTRYGRCSSSRLCTYTIVVSRDYLDPEKSGQAKVVPFKDTFDFSLIEDFEDQIYQLAKVEGIWKTNSKVYAKDWGVIAIWIKSNSEFTKDIQGNWNTIIQNNGYEAKFTFDWSDGSLITQDYKLDLDIEVKEIDFLLITYIHPKHKNIMADKRKKYPTPQEVAEAIKASGYSTYFCQNRVNGITTFDDEEIFKHIK